MHGVQQNIFQLDNINKLDYWIFFLHKYLDGLFLPNSCVFYVTYFSSVIIHFCEFSSRKNDRRRGGALRSRMTSGSAGRSKNVFSLAGRPFWRGLSGTPAVPATMGRGRVMRHRFSINLYIYICNNVSASAGTLFHVSFVFSRAIFLI